jgi:histidyl-tRNA synthetase
MNSERPRGTRDFTPEEMRKRHFVETKLRQVAGRFNYGEVLFPLFEHTQLFQTKSGEELVDHMYVFEDKGKRSLCLRPEATASVARMFGSSLRNMQKPVKVYYYAPMYRYEEPQKNRYREFWQFGFELIGSNTRESDAEVLLLAVDCLRELGIEHTLELSHLNILRTLLAELGIDESQQDHVIACLDRKNIGELKKIVKDKVFYDLMELKGGNAIEKARSLLKDHIKVVEKLDELSEIASLLDSAKIEYSINLGMARGLAYYTGMVFEIRVQGLGAQNQICGGGRYDNLVKLFSGLDEPAVGFAFGFDRVLDALETQKIRIPTEEGVIVVAPAGVDARIKAFEIASQLRKKGVRVELDLMNRKLGRVLEYASSIKAGYAVIVGLKELQEGKVVLRDMNKKEQKEVKIQDLEKILIEN